MQNEKLKILLSISAEMFFQISTLEDIETIKKIAISQTLKIDKELKTL